MKKILSLILASLAIFCVACAKEPPSEYEFYNSFSKAVAEPLQEKDISKFTNVTVDENLDKLIVDIGLTHLEDHKVYSGWKSAVVNLYFGENVNSDEIKMAMEYVYNTFWLGEYHTMNILPYEDWQNRDQIRTLTVQYFYGDDLLVSELYEFKGLLDSGEKPRDYTINKNSDIILKGDYIDLKNHLQGTDEQLAAYADLSEYIDMPATTEIYHSLFDEKLYINVTTEAKQIAPEKINLLYDALYERYSFLNENIFVQLSVKDKGMYFEYSHHVELPTEEE